MNLQELFGQFQAQPKTREDYMRSLGYRQNEDTHQWTNGMGSEGAMLGGEQLDPHMAQFNNSNDPGHFLSGNNFTPLNTFSSDPSLPYTGAYGMRNNDDQYTTFDGQRGPAGLANYSAQDYAKFMNPGGRMIGSGDPSNPWGMDLWETIGPSKTRSYNSPETFMDNLGLYGVGLIGGAGMLANSGMFGGASLSGDALGLSQMGQAAGLSGNSLQSFITSGGTLGSTAAGGGGVGFGAIADSPWGVGLRDNAGFLDDITNSADFFDPEMVGNTAGSNLTTSDLSSLFNPQSGMSQSLAPSFPGAQSPISGYNLGTSAASAGSASPSLIDKLLNQFKPVDIAKSGINYFLNQRTSDQLAQAAQEAAARSDALSQPKRAPYQEQLASLLSNPEAFYSTNPVVKAQLDVARQQFLANTAKMGTGGTQFNDYLKNVQNVASGTFNDQAQLLSMLGGFNQGTGYAGNVFGNLQGQAIRQAETANYMLPKLIDNLFKVFEPSNPAVRSSY